MPRKSPALPKSAGPVGGKCHVSFGPYTIIVAGSYSADGSCCGKTLCTDNCGGQKYIDVCIACDADEDIQCGDGHHPVARTSAVPGVLVNGSGSVLVRP